MVAKRCEVCGTQLNIEKENVYEVIAKNQLFGFSEKWNATDCLYCGCQNLLKKRYENETQKEQQLLNSLKVSEINRESEGKDNE